MPPTGHGRVRDLAEFTDADAALARIVAIYEPSAEAGRREFAALAAGRPKSPDMPWAACYPYLGMSAAAAQLNVDARLAYGVLLDPGAYGTTLTRPDLFGSYYREQIAMLLKHHNVPVVVGMSDRPIPLPFVVEDSTADITEAQVRAMQERFALPDLATTNDAIANGTYRPPQGEPKPLALFEAPRVDYSLHRLSHYTATALEHFQRFVLLTNYQRYVEEFRAYALEQVSGTQDEFSAFIEPGDVVTPNPALRGGARSG